MSFISAHKNDIGRNKKRNNEDYIWVDQQAGLFIVADGMGGYRGGEVASRLAATTISEIIVSYLKEKTRPLSTDVVKTLMFKAVEAANRAVLKAAQETGHDKMGTTVVMAQVEASMAYICHVGDSRAYLVRGSATTQLTQDHSWVNFVQSASSSSKPAKSIEHVLTQAIGQATPPDPSFTQTALEPGDYLLLCSDGLWNMVDDNRILAELLRAGDRVDRAVEALIDAANAAGGKDNISVVIVKHYAP
jgi:protein phosphatase